MTAFERYYNQARSELNSDLSLGNIRKLFNVAIVAVEEESVKRALEISNECKEALYDLLTDAGEKRWDLRTVIAFSDFSKQNGEATQETDLFWEILKFEGKYWLDSYALYIEKNRKPDERFYLPRRKTLLKVVDVMQRLEDDELDEVFIHMPARVGKSQIITIGLSWHCARHPLDSNLYITYKEGLGGAFLIGVMEIWTDNVTYAFRDIFPDVMIAPNGTDAKNHKVDLVKKKKYASLSGKGLESGLNGEYDAVGWMVIDDILEGIQDVLNPDVLHRKQTVFDNNVMSRKKSGCKVIYNGTIWSLHDIYMDRLAFLESNPEAKHIRWTVLKIPALDDNDESNFDYEYNKGFNTKYYRMMRSKFEENDDMASWLAQYQQEPIERDGAVFTPEHMRFYNGVLPDEEPIRICSACDVALGGLDYLSMPLAYVYEHGIYIHDWVYDNSEKNVTQPLVVDCLIRNNAGSAFFEANQGGEGYKDDIDRMLRESGVKLNLVSEYAPTGKRKEQRIWDKAPSIREYYFLDNEHQSAMYRKAMTNVYSFTVNGKNKHEDAPDSLATLAYFIEGTWGNRMAQVIRNPFGGR